MSYRLPHLKSAAMLLAAALAMSGTASADKPIPVVATFSILGDMVARVGGDRITLTTLVGPDGDVHVYSPTPQDAAAVAGAEVLFLNGLEFEGWLERLAEASPFGGEMVVVTERIEAIAYGEDHDDHHEEHEEHEEHSDDDHHGHEHGAFDPHAWHVVENAIVYVDNIAAGLARADPEHASTYYNNRAAYVAELEALDAEIGAMMAAIPDHRRTVVTPHDAFGYLAAHHGMLFLAPVGGSTESEASAADVAAIITQIRDEGVSAVFVETITDNRLIERIADETGAKVGGTLYSDALSSADGPASNYIEMMRHNARTLSEALSD